MSSTETATKPVNITLPDGTVKTYDGPVTGADVAADIGPGLAKAAIAVMINGELADLSRPIDRDSDLRIITLRDEDDIVLPLIRHDAAISWPRRCRSSTPAPR